MNTSMVTPIIPLSQPFKFLQIPKPVYPQFRPTSHSHHFSVLIPPNSPFPSTRILSLYAVNSARIPGHAEPETNDELFVEASVTKTLPPALTLYHGLQALQDSLHEFKQHPPNSPSGFIRFQVAVPPTANALNWFCCQPESSGVYPQFYMSKQPEELLHESAFLSRARGVFGIGAAVCFSQSSSSSDKWITFRRLN